MSSFQDNILTVTELNNSIKSILESIPEISVKGEISNFKKHVSGHWYFSLKDENSQITCNMWRGINNYVKFEPENGMKVTVTGKLNVYVPYGNYSINVRAMNKLGIGDLYEQFEKLKVKLASEGLFSQEHKKELPKYPKRIGIVTARDGAALRDMINIAKRRYPIVELLLCPAKVQGENAKESISDSIKLLNSIQNVDLIIVGRGGGSIEDLWAFNEEIVARTIFGSKIPIISAVGHETDTTIADFVSDMRAPTPSAAMEIATPNLEDIREEFIEFMNDYILKLKHIYSSRLYAYEKIIGSYAFVKPNLMLQKYSAAIKNSANAMQRSMDYRITVLKNKSVVINSALLERLINQKLDRLAVSKSSMERNINTVFSKKIIYFERKKETLLNAQKLMQNIIDKNKTGIDVKLVSLQKNIDFIHTSYKGKLELNSAIIRSYDVNKTLRKGFALVKKDGKFIDSVAKLKAEKKAEIIFYDGKTDITTK